MLSVSMPPTSVGAKLLTLAASSTSLTLRLVFKPKKPFAFDVPDDGPEEVESSLPSWLYICVLVYDSCVVAFETSCGRAVVVECAVDGRDPRKLAFFGRGGSGGGVPSLDSEDSELYEVFREALCIMLIVGLMKSRGSKPSCFFAGVAGGSSGAVCEA